MTLTSGLLIQCRKALQPILPKRLQQDVACPPLVSRPHGDQRLIDESPHRFGHLSSSNTVPGADGLSGFESETADEDSEPREDDALARREQLVAPVNGGTQSSMTDVPASAPRPQQREPVTQAPHYLAG